MGTWIFGDTTIKGVQASAYGYPAYYICPDGSLGASLDNCPGGALRYTGTQPNFTGAQMMTMAADDLDPGSVNGAHIIQTTMDVTDGESGMALVYFSGTDRRGAARGRRLVECHVARSWVHGDADPSRGHHRSIGGPTRHSPALSSASTTRPEAGSVAGAKTA
jgi:hypothetical protein